MARTQKPEVGGLLRLPTPPSVTVNIAIKGNSKSKYVVDWALEKFIPEGMFLFKLIFVRPTITAVPTPVGSFRLSEVREDLVTAYRREIEWQTDQKLLPFKKMCIRRKVDAEIVQIESDDVVEAISREVDQSSVNKLVIGASSRGMFSRRRNVSSEIAESIPKFCTVYAVAKGKLSALRPSVSETHGTIKEDNSETSSSTNDSSIQNTSSHPEWTESTMVASYAHFHFPSLPMQRFHALSNVNQTLLHKKTNSTETIDLDIDGDDVVSSCPGNSDIGHPSGALSSCQNLETDTHSWISHQASISDGLPEFSSESQMNVDFELEKLRIELRHIRGMYAMAQSEAIDASRKVNDLQKRLMEDGVKLEEINVKEVEAKELAIQERVKYEAAKKEAEYVKECAEREAAEKNEAENKALQEAKEKEKLENVLVGPLQQYQKFKWEDIVSATSSFSDNLKIGWGAYGTVYKCSLHHTTAAVKVLHSKEAQKNKQFQQELEVLSTIRHPHLLILLGACPDHGCLVYEYMENGSLEDRLFRKNNTPPIPWFQRYRIAWEIASALVFLHSTSPQPIIHRDLKPANILLDHNFVSKIGDVGLSKMLDSDSCSALLSTMCNETGPVGTLCYIDPEYQRTGLISTKSDIYAFGMVILQLVTGKSARALTHVVETAVDEGDLADVLDTEAGNWPYEETKELALLGLRCAELRRKDRPSLRDQVLPALERLKDFADRARHVGISAPQAPPNHFICPILQDVMEDPCVAADGYTYDRKAIEIWLEENDNSPMTNLPLPNKILIPNYTLLSAIMGWKSGK
ncbi:hypothetical protein RHMOL_Rhmol03G0187700 [Rhododendron molle]|uniref:Uncharacterized protein n=2 Tax=Rhododendron molle TaxID=49168 RepID=A0ACC0PFP3_RHOML|nr:hypothetical protein RHMOL_Rhmol03G0187700 [Rhododendron molle]KAI8564517.1 hypothetical protein RHMOL_Rhmol03G0187700 [Rhododendron molle]